MPVGSASARGQASVEALLLTALVAIVLFVGDPSPVERLIEALKSLHQQFSFLIALP
ncbi:MAG: hypothetical protein R3E87_26485 [Burkholderiaceae bacterium]